MQRNAAPKEPHRKTRLLNNTVFLYIMAFSTQLLNLVTIPYLTRVLGPMVYGKIGLAVGYMTYVRTLAQTDTP